jgi:outer membrane protein assembly factor BamB
VYVTCYEGNSTYQVMALNRSTGNKVWNQGFITDLDEVSQPSVGNGKVYVHQWGHSGISGGDPSQYPYMIGMDAQTGTKQFATSHAGQWSSGSRPTVAGTQVFAAGGYYGGLDAYNGLSGDSSWFAKVNQQYGWIPAADSQNVYVYMGPASSSPGPQVGTLYAFNRNTGASAFTIQNPDDLHTLYDGTVFLGSQNDALTLTYNKTITSFDLVNKSVRWRKAGNFNGSFAFDDGRVFAGNGIELDELDEATGNVLRKWFAPSGEYLAGNLLVTESLIFAQTNRSSYAIDRLTLSPVWSTSSIGDLALGDGMLLISNASSVVAFAVPEPASILIMLAGGAALTARRRA